MRKKSFTNYRRVCRQDNNKIDGKLDTPPNSIINNNNNKVNGELDDILSKEETIEKESTEGKISASLRNLRDILPNEGPIVYKFAEYLANDIGNGKLHSIGYELRLTIALYDLEKGVDGFTGEPIDNELKGLLDKEPKKYNLLLNLFSNQVKSILTIQNAFEADKDTKEEGLGNVGGLLSSLVQDGDYDALNNVCDLLKDENGNYNI